MIDKAAQKLVDRAQGKPNRDYVTEEEHKRQGQAIFHVGSALFPGVGEFSVGIPGPPLLTADAGIVGLSTTTVVVPNAIIRAPALLASIGGEDGGAGAGSEPVPDRIVVGRGQATGRSSVPDPQGMATKTLAPPSAKPDLKSFLQSAPKNFPQFVGKVKEIFLERLGLNAAGGPGGLTPEGIKAARELLAPGGKLQILELPNAAATSMSQVEAQIRAMLPADQWGNITVAVQRNAQNVAEGLLVTAKKL